jgi:predicted O-methyltransferase YrrM
LANQLYTQSYTFPKETWLKILGHVKSKENMKYLEAGVFEGRFLLWVAENILPEKTRIHVVDRFYLEGLKDRFTRNTEPLKEKHELQVFEGLTEIMLPRLKPQDYDLIYLDAGHTYCDVWNDLVRAWPLLNTGGYMVIDDYIWLKFLVIGAERPEKAVDDFLRLAKGSYRLVYRDVQVFVQKTAELPEGLQPIESSSPQIPKPEYLPPKIFGQLFLKCLYFLYAVKRSFWLKFKGKENRSTT